MKRRELLVGLGGVAGSAGALGTGAFATVKADRTVSVSIADENQAYLALSPATTANSNFAFQDDSTDGRQQLSLGFSGVGVTGQGVGTSSDYSFDGVFEVTNQGTQAVDLYVEQLGASDFVDGPGTGNSPTGKLDVTFYPGSSSGSPLTASDASPPNSVNIGIGNSQLIGVNIDVGNVNIENWSAEVTVEAETS